MKIYYMRVSDLFKGSLERALRDNDPYFISKEFKINYYLENNYKNRDLALFAVYIDNNIYYVISNGCLGRTKLKDDYYPCTIIEDSLKFKLYLQIE